VLEAKTISVSIPVPWRDVYEAIWRPECFPRWASGLSQSSLELDGGGWRAQGAEGPIRIRFTDHNPYGVMDPYVDTGSGPEVYVPMRGIPTAKGAEVILTVFRQPVDPVDMIIPAVLFGKHRIEGNCGTLPIALLNGLDLKLVCSFGAGRLPSTRTRPHSMS
jgi:hypothetical protein